MKYLCGGIFRRYRAGFRTDLIFRIFQDRWAHKYQRGATIAGTCKQCDPHRLSKDPNKPNSGHRNPSSNPQKPPPQPPQTHPSPAKHTYLHYTSTSVKYLPWDTGRCLCDMQIRGFFTRVLLIRRAAAVHFNISVPFPVRFVIDENTPRIKASFANGSRFFL